MTATVTLEVIGQEKLARTMDSMAQHFGKDLRPMLRVIRDWWWTWQSAIFASEGSEIGSRWKKLSPKYKLWKNENYPYAQILELTGALHSAMTGGSGSFEKIKKQRMDLGVKGTSVFARIKSLFGKRKSTPADYVLAHNFGYAPNNLPARPFLKITEEAQIDLDKALQYLLADIKRRILSEAGGPGGMAR